MAEALTYGIDSSLLSIDSTMGAMYIGVSIAGMFYGASIIQTWYYFTHYSDSWPLKVLVALVFFCDSAHQVFLMHMMYDYLVINFSNPTTLGELVWSLIIEVLLIGLIGLLVQSFFTYRTYQLSGKNLYLTCLLASLALAEFGLSVAFTAEAIQLSTFAELLTLKNLSRSVNAVAAASNVSIAVAMVILLHKNKTGLRRGDSMINTLIIFSLNTGLLTSLCALLSLITITAFPGTLIYTCFFFVLGRAYTNSFLASLNVRAHLQLVDLKGAIPTDSVHLTYIFSPHTKGLTSTEILDERSHCL